MCFGTIYKMHTLVAYKVLSVDSKTTKNRFLKLNLMDCFFAFLKPSKIIGSLCLPNFYNDIKN
jgi:hypothetical protein